jgi:hypothetical protein
MFKDYIQCQGKIVKENVQFDCSWNLNWLSILKYKFLERKKNKINTKFPNSMPFIYIIFKLKY